MGTVRAMVVASVGANSGVYKCSDWFCSILVVISACGSMTVVVNVNMVMMVIISSHNVLW